MSSLAFPVYSSSSFSIVSLINQGCYLAKDIDLFMEKYTVSDNLRRAALIQDRRNQTTELTDVCVIFSMYIGFYSRPSVCANLPAMDGAYRQSSNRQAEGTKRCSTGSVSCRVSVSFCSSPLWPQVFKLNSMKLAGRHL